MLSLVDKTLASCFVRETPGISKAVVITKKHEKVVQTHGVNFAVRFLSPAARFAPRARPLARLPRPLRSSPSLLLTVASPLLSSLLRPSVPFRRRCGRAPRPT